MNDIKVYLEIEYGYLGFGVIYDFIIQFYVKILEYLLKMFVFDV